MDTIELLNDPALFELNVTLLEPKLKHPTIFKHFDALQPGDAFFILNDHDPKPIYYQMIAQRGNVFTWKYVQQGPTWWKVLVQKNVADNGPTVGELAAADIRKAEVFKKFGIDFCCGGKISLKQACAQNNLDASEVEQALLEATLTERKATFDFSRWGLDFLSDYIYNEHHRYWYDEEPVITELVNKVADHHGTNHPELTVIKDLYSTLRQELNAHFIKEERVLFPHIKDLVRAKHQDVYPINSALPNIDEPLQMMEADHEAAGDLLKQIRKAANNFTLPADACNSFGLMYHKLKGLEEDLHQHIHLENNILFPKAALLHKQLIK